MPLIMPNKGCMNQRPLFTVLESISSNHSNARVHVQRRAVHLNNDATGVPTPKHSVSKRRGDQSMRSAGDPLPVIGGGGDVTGASPPSSTGLPAARVPVAMATRLCLHRRQFVRSRCTAAIGHRLTAAVTPLKGHGRRAPRRTTPAACLSRCEGDCATRRRRRRRRLVSIPRAGRQRIIGRR